MGKKRSSIQNNNVKAVNPPQKPIPTGNFLNITILVGLVILLFYAPFFRGLYFNEEMSTTFLYSGLLFFAFLIKRLLDKDFKVIRSWLDIAAIVMVLIYALPLMFGFAASAQGAWDKFLRYINYYLIYIMCRDIIKGYGKIKILLNAIIVSALGVCVLGVDAGAGSALTNRINWFLQQIPLWLHLNTGAASLMSFKFFGGFAEGRIFSTLQYPNVLASYLGAVFFIVVGLLMVTSSYWKRAWYGAVGFVVFYSFILTGSRGMILVLPIMVLILFACFWNKKLTLGFIVDAFIPVVTGVLFSAMFGNLVNSGQYSKVWITILLGTLISAFLTSVIQKLKNIIFKVSTKIYAAAAATVIIVFIILIGIALNIEKPLLIKHDSKEASSEKLVVRDITNIRPATKYILDFEVDARSNALKDNSYKIAVLSMDKFVNVEQLVEVNGKTEKASKAIEFVTKQSTTTIRLQLQNFSQNTSASFSNFVLKEADTGKVTKLIIQYKYLPTELVYKIKDISLKTHNAWERLVFVEDAFKIIAAYPFGIGGGGWRALYHQYQSYQYASNEVHNYPVQLWVETGILGIVTLIAFVVLIIHNYRKIRIEEKELEPEDAEGFDKIILSGVILTSILSLYAHSVIDFDFSLSAIPIMAWALTGIIAGMYTLRKNFKDFEIKIYEGSDKRKYTDIMPKLNYIFSAVIVVFALILVISGFNSLSGRNLIAKADAIESTFKTNNVQKKEVEKVLPQLVTTYREYLQVQPLDEKKRQRYIEYLNMYPMLIKDLSTDQRKEFESQLSQSIETNVKNEPNSLDSLSTAASFSIAIGKYDKGIEYADKVAVQGKFIGQAYAVKGQLYILAGESAVQAGQKEKANDYFKKASGIKKEFEEISKKSLKPLTVPTEIDQVVIQAQQKLAELGVK